MVEEKDDIQVERLNVLERREKHRGGLQCGPLFYLHFLMVEQVKAIWSSCQILAEFDGGSLCMGLGGIYVCLFHTKKRLVFLRSHYHFSVFFFIFQSCTFSRSSYHSLQCTSSCTCSQNLSEQLTFKALLLTTDCSLCRSAW